MTKHKKIIKFKNLRKHRRTHATYQIKYGNSKLAIIFINNSYYGDDLVGYRIFIETFPFLEEDIDENTHLRINDHKFKISMHKWNLGKYIEWIPV